VSDHHIMISYYWFSLLWIPTTIGIAAASLLATPYGLWEFGQWRIAYLRRSLPLHCYVRVAAPLLVTMALLVALAIGGASVATNQHWTFPRHAALDAAGGLAALCLYPLSLTVVWRSLRMPFAMPGVGPYTPRQHGAAGAAGRVG